MDHHNSRKANTTKSDSTRVDLSDSDDDFQESCKPKPAPGKHSASKRMIRNTGNSSFKTLAVRQAASAQSSSLNDSNLNTTDNSAPPQNNPVNPANPVNNPVNPVNLDKSLSVLERSSLCFGPGGKDPRIKAIAAKTKSSLIACDTQLKEITVRKGSTEAIWEKFYKTFGSTEGIEEEIYDWNEEFKEIKLLDDRLSNSSDDDIEVVDEDECEKSAKEASGSELASFLRGYNTEVKSELSNSARVKKEKCLVHISGTMSTNICQGTYSNFENTMTVKVFGLDIKFPKKYLERLRVMTGFDLRQTAYKIHIAVNDKGSSSTVQLLNQTGELRNIKKLNNTSLVNESVTSELNRSIRAKRVLSMLTPKREVKVEGYDDPSDLSLNSSTMNRSSAIKRTLSLVTPRKTKIEEVDIKEVKQERLESSFSDAQLNRSRKLLSMLTPRKPGVEKQTAKNRKEGTSTASKNFNNSTLNKSDLNKSSLLERTLSLVTPKRHKVEIKTEIHDQGSTFFEPPLKVKTECLDQNSALNVLPLKISPDFERCKSNIDLSHSLTSPLKRNHDHHFDISHCESPSKRIRFHDESVLSSTRLDETVNCHREQDGYSFNPNSSRINPVSYQIPQMSRSHSLPNHQERENHGTSFTDYSSGCTGSCCKTSHIQHGNRNHHQQHHYNHFQPHQQEQQQQPPVQHYHQYPQYKHHQYQPGSHHQQHHQPPGSHHQSYGQEHLPQQPHRQQQGHLQHLPQHHQHHQNNTSYSVTPCTGPCCAPRPSHNFSIPHNTHQTLPLVPTRNQPSHHVQKSSVPGQNSTRQPLAHCQVHRSSENDSVSDRRLALPKENSAGMPGVHVPVVTELLKGLNSSKRKLKINVEYDVQLDDNDSLENSFTHHVLWTPNPFDLNHSLMLV